MNSNLDQHAERVARIALVHRFDTRATVGLLEELPATEVVEALADQAPFGARVLGPANAEAERILERAAEHGARFVIPGDGDWPAALDRFGDSTPLGLWVRGRGFLPDLLRRCVAVTGSKAASPYGHQVAGWLAGSLADQGVTVMASVGFGVDGAALEASARRGAYAAAPIGAHAGGITARNPEKWAQLERSVLDSGGLLLSLHDRKTPTGGVGRQDQRRRLMLCLAGVTVLTEETRASWYADAAEQFGQPLLAVPGAITETRSFGVNELIRDARAQAVTSAEDIVRVLDRP